jgi:hypothetical protein
MCCFSPLETSRHLSRLAEQRLTVAGTRIFARLDLSGAAPVQWLAYSMALATPADVAMILAIPVAERAEDALSFVDISAYPNLFADLDALFPDLAHMEESEDELPAPQAATRKPLVVHSVGSFEASYVPSLADFDRLDARFRIPDKVWDRRREYRDYGFAVFKLKAGEMKDIHPMAFRFGTREPGRIFFPTLHVHDGKLHARAAFDHTLFFQVPKGAVSVPIAPGEDVARSRGRRAQRSPFPAEHAVDLASARGLVAREGVVSKWNLHGELPNQDTWVRVATAPARRRARPG